MDVYWKTQKWEYSFTVVKPEEVAHMFTRAMAVFAKVPGRMLAYPVVVDSRKILSSLLVLLALAAASADQLGAVGPGFSVDLSHFAAFGGWNTIWSIINTSHGPNQCTLAIVGPDGQPLSLTTTAGTGSSINVGVALGGSAVIQAGGPGSGLTGASNVTCTAAFIASLRYQWMPAGVVETQVSVDPTNIFANHVFAASAYTGISMYDPNTTAAAATITAYDLNGNTVGSALATIPAGGKTIGNLIKLIPTLPSSFQGRVAITANAGIEVVALDVTPGSAGSFVLGNVPVVHYNPQNSSYSGTYNFISGPQSGQTGTFTITNIAPVGDLFGEASYLGTASNGTVSGGLNIVEYNNGQVFLRFFGSFTPLAHAGGALTQESDGSYSGTLYMESATGSSIANVTIH